MNDETPAGQVAKKAAAIEQLLERIASYNDLVSHEQHELASCLSEFRRDASAAAEENRKLRIGIIGQVKAGKSSLLNALLFNGNDVLPKAATPMTAALTVIRHDTRTWAEVEFYSEEDWQRVIQANDDYWKLYRQTETEMLKEQTSRRASASPAAPTRNIIEKRAGISDELKTARELLEQATTDVIGMVGSPNVHIEAVDDPQMLTERLEQYIGAQGRYTPIVKSSVIYYDHEHLKNLEIIDTPGLNDPILSRGARTREYMGQCDVVFLLIKCERFPDETDMQLLLCNIPAKGIKDVLIIGSQFDDQLSGEAARYNSIRQLVANLAKGYCEELMNLLQGRLEQCRSDKEREIFNRLITACTRQTGEAKVVSPVFLSAMAFKAARHFSTPDHYEQHCINTLNSLYPDFTVSPEILDQLSNIDQIKLALHQHEQRKQEILQGRLAEILNQIVPRFAELQKNLISAVDRKLENLGKVELKDIQEKERHISNRINKGRSAVEDAFDNSIFVIKSKFIQLLADMKSLSREFSRLRELTDTKLEDYEAKIPRRFWGFDVSWIAGHRTETRTRTVTIQYANVHDAIEGVIDFVVEVEARLIKDIGDIVNIRQLQNDILKAAEHFVDLSDDSGQVDLEEEIILPVKRVLRSISIPQINFGGRDRYTAAITSKFSGRVEEGKIDKLRAAKAAAIDGVIKDLDAVLKAKLAETEAYLQKTRDEFIAVLEKDIKSDLDQYREMLLNKKAALKRLEELKGILAS